MTTFIAVILLVALLIGFTYWTWRLHQHTIRIGQVHDYRIKLIDLIDAAAKEDLKNGIFQYTWRYDMFHTVSFEQMLHSREPLDSFYPDKSFLYPSSKPFIDVNSWEVADIRGELNP